MKPIPQSAKCLTQAKVGMPCMVMGVSVVSGRERAKKNANFTVQGETNIGDKFGRAAREGWDLKKLFQEYLVRSNKLYKPSNLEIPSTWLCALLGRCKTMCGYSSSSTCHLDKGSLPPFRYKPKFAK